MGLQVALTLTYLLGDVLQISVGDFKAGEIEDKKMTQKMLMRIAILMLIPIVMVFLTLTLEYSMNRWLNIIASIELFGFNLVRLPTYSGVYD